MKLMDKSLKITNSSLSHTIIKSFLVAAYLIAFLTASLMLTGCGSFQLSLDHEDREPTQPVATGITPPSTGTPSEEETQVTLDNPWPSFIGEPFREEGESTTILSIEDGIAAFTQSPVNMEILWDYSGPTGKIAYASEFYHASRAFSRSVTDLWVYDYTADSAEQWLQDDVGRAYWSPHLPGSSEPQQLVAAVFDSDVGAFNLVLVEGPGRTRELAQCSSGQFAFSPDGRQIAYMSGWYNETRARPDECTGVFVVDIGTGSIARLTGTDPLATGGWYRDQPLWAESLEALLLKSFNEDSIFNLVPLGGSEWYPVSISDSIEERYLPTPLLSLWSDAHRSVIGQTEGMFDPHAVWLYRFSEDGGQIEEAFRVNWGEFQHDVILLGWWEPGESVLIRDISNPSQLNPLGEVVVWSLGERAVVETVSVKPEFPMTIYPDDVTTGIPELDQILGVILNDDTSQRETLAQPIKAACTAEEFFVGPPPCEPGMPEGTLVERFPYQRYREQRYAKPGEIAEVMDFDVLGLYAIATYPQGGVALEYSPVGEYHIALVSDVDHKLINVIVAKSRIVKLEFWELAPPEVFSNFGGQYILPPL